MQASDKKHLKELKRKRKRKELHKRKQKLAEKRAPKKAVAHSVIKSNKTNKTVFDKDAWVKAVAPSETPPLKDGDEAKTV